MYLLEAGDKIRFHLFRDQAHAEEFLKLPKGDLDGYWDKSIEILTADGSTWYPFDTPKLHVEDHR
jgi:hypothetical protein